MNCQAEGSLFTARRLSLPTNGQRDKKRNKRLNKITILFRSCCDKKAFIFFIFSGDLSLPHASFMFPLKTPLREKRAWEGRRGKENVPQCTVHTSKPPCSPSVYFHYVSVRCVCVCVCAWKEQSRMCMCVSEASAGSGTALPFKLPPFMSPPVPHHPDPTQKNAIFRKRIKMKKWPSPCR